MIAWVRIQRIIILSIHPKKGIIGTSGVLLGKCRMFRISCRNLTKMREDCTRTHRFETLFLFYSNIVQIDNNKCVENSSYDRTTPYDFFPFGNRTIFTRKPQRFPFFLWSSSLMKDGASDTGRERNVDGGPGPRSVVAFFYHNPTLLTKYYFCKNNSSKKTKIMILNNEMRKRNNRSIPTA